MLTQDITVIKRNPQGIETWRYSGHVLERAANFIRLEAPFNRNDMPFHEIILGRGDRFIETFFTDRWYNIIEMHDRLSGELKGWYCNVTCPAEIENEVVSYIDLALDLLVYPDGRQLVLDEDEFAELALSSADVLSARQALRELEEHFHVYFKG